MGVSRRDFLYLSMALGLTGANGAFAAEGKKLDEINYNDLIEFKDTGNVTILHVCDMHAHIKPLYWREPSTLLSAKSLVGHPGFLCGESFMKFYGISKNGLNQYFDTHIDFDRLAPKFGQMGGIAYIKKVVSDIIAHRGKENCLFLDSGDTWQGTGVALKSNGEAIVEAQNYLGIEVMTPHWEFTYGKEQVTNLIDKLDADFIAQNVFDNDPFSDTFEERIFKPYTMKTVGGAKIAIIGQAFPFTPTANPARFTEGWSFGVRNMELQTLIDEIRDKEQPDCVILLSHDGFSVDQELARRVTGLDFILSGHTHDPAPKPITINGTVIIISGSHGKYVGRLDIDIKNKKVKGYEFKLIPIASKLIEADKDGVALVDKLYAPYADEMNKTLGKSKSILYKRDTFYSTFDALIGRSIRDRMDSEISFTPGYRWGTTILPGEGITMEHIYDMTAITYPEVYTFDLGGERIAQLLEDIADNVFNEDPMLQQGGDMSRLDGISYDITIGAQTGKRITNIKVNDKPLDLKKKYKISAWGGNLQNAGENLQKSKIMPVYDIVAQYVQKMGTVDIPLKSNVNIKDIACGCPNKILGC